MKKVLFISSQDGELVALFNRVNPKEEGEFDFLCVHTEQDVKKVCGIHTIDVVVLLGQLQDPPPEKYIPNLNGFLPKLRKELGPNVPFLAASADEKLNHNICTAGMATEVDFENLADHLLSLP